MERIVIGSVLLALTGVSVTGQSCRKTPYIDDSSRYPSKPLRFSDLDAIIARGSGGKSRTLYEIYGLQELANPPSLRKVKVNWQKLPNGTYFNEVAGWFPLYSVCYESSLYFTTDLSEGSTYVRLKFSILLPPPDPLVEYTGTMYSSCPERYIISWFCPTLALRGKRCLYGARMSLLTFDSIDDMPWHLVTANICKNKSPYLDEDRWKFTHKGEEGRG